MCGSGVYALRSWSTIKHTGNTEQPEASNSVADPYRGTSNGHPLWEDALQRSRELIQNVKV